MPQLRIPSHEPSTRSTDFASPAELLSKLSIFWFSLLSPKEQQNKIEQISNKLGAEGVKVRSLAAAAAAPGETKEDVRRKAFAMLFNKAPVVTRVDLFKEITKKFFDERRLCEGILLSGQLGSNEQQEEIDEIKQSRYAEFYLGLSIIWFKARCASDPRNLIQVVVGKAGVDDHIFEKLVNETEEDFKLRRFTESFKQLQFSSQEDIVEFIQDAVFRDLVDDVSNTFEMSDTICAGDGSSNVDFHNFGNTTSSRPFWERLLEFFKMCTGLGMCDTICAGVRPKKKKISEFRRRCSRAHFGAGADAGALVGAGAFVAGAGAFDGAGADAFVGAGAGDFYCGDAFDGAGAGAFVGAGAGDFFGDGAGGTEPSPEFIKMSFPDPRRPGGATATQGGGQAAITQGGQGTSQQ